MLSQSSRHDSSGKAPSDAEELQPYKSRLVEPSIHNGCILWETRVTVPPPGRSRTIEQLHESHPGICRMKSLARSYVWWPGMDWELEAKVRACEVCQQTRPLDRPVPIHSWEWPRKPWSIGSTLTMHDPYLARCIWSSLPCFYAFC